MNSNSVRSLGSAKSGGFSRFFVGAVALGLSLSSATARAGEVVDVLAASTYVRGTWANFGYSFTVNEPVRVSALGLWDRFGDGLAEEHEVGLWDGLGNLLAHVIVDSATPASPSANANHAWRFEDVAPVILMPGTYKLGAFYPTTADAFVATDPAIGSNIVFAPQVTFGSSYVTTGGTEFFTEPVATTGFNPGFFGPNARITPIPEPATLGCLAMAGLVVLRKRKWN